MSRALHLDFFDLPAISILPKFDKCTTLCYDYEKTNCSDQDIFERFGRADSRKQAIDDRL
jgi:hypothetical protein